MRDRSGDHVGRGRGGAFKARHRALSLPDAIALVVADLIGADALWTCDRRWTAVDSRVAIP
jgi:predicted nucleic acid-binding protein